MGRLSGKSVSEPSHMSRHRSHHIGKSEASLFRVRSILTTFTWEGQFMYRRDTIFLHKWVGWVAKVFRSHRICHDINPITLGRARRLFYDSGQYWPLSPAKVNLCTWEIPYFSINGSAEWQKCFGAIAYVTTSMPSHWEERGEFLTIPVNIDHFHLRRSIYVPKRYHISP